MMSKPISVSEGFVGGRKYDDDKPRFDLIPPAAEAALARVLTIGARKYAAHGWRTVPAARERYLAALRRHLNAHKRQRDAGPREWRVALGPCVVQRRFSLRTRTGGGQRMKPIDIQNAALLAQLQTTGARRSIAPALRAGGVSLGYSDIDRALLTLERDGLVFLWGMDHPSGDVSLPIYALTAVGRVEAKQLPGAGA